MVTPAPFAARYQLVRRLGVGGQGEVYEAFDNNERVTVAIKLFPPAPTVTWLEAIILRALEGHYILPIHNADVFLGQAYLVTALARNGSVDQRITPRIGLDIDTAVAWKGASAPDACPCPTSLSLPRRLCTPAEPVADRVTTRPTRGTQ